MINYKYEKWNYLYEKIAGEEENAGYQHFLVAIKVF